MEQPNGSLKARKTFPNPDPAGKEHRQKPLLRKKLRSSASPQLTLLIAGKCSVISLTRPAVPFMTATASRFRLVTSALRSTASLEISHPLPREISRLGQNRLITMVRSTFFIRMRRLWQNSLSLGKTKKRFLGRTHRFCFLARIGVFS